LTDPIPPKISSKFVRYFLNYRGNRQMDKGENVSYSAEVVIVSK